MIALTMVYRREIERRYVQFSEFDTYPIDRMLCYILSYVYLDKYNCHPFLYPPRRLHFQYM